MWGRLGKQVSKKIQFVPSGSYNLISLSFHINDIFVINPLLHGSTYTITKYIFLLWAWKGFYISFPSGITNGDMKTWHVIP